jgi:hypothetical protein
MSPVKFISFLKGLLTPNKFIWFSNSKYYFSQKEQVLELNVELIPVENKITDDELSKLKKVLMDGIKVDGEGVIKVKIHSKNVKKIIESIVNME